MLGFFVQEAPTCDFQADYQVEKTFQEGSVPLYFVLVCMCMLWNLIVFWMKFFKIQIGNSRGWNAD